MTRLGWRARRRGNRRLRRGYCPLCYSSPPDPECRVCGGTADYGPNQTHDTAEHWWVEWRRIIGYPPPATKGLIVGRGKAPRLPPPHAVPSGQVPLLFVGPPPRTGAMPDRFEELATYNAERWRGIVHTPGYDVRMRELQADFDRWAGMPKPGEVMIMGEMRPSKRPPPPGAYS